jgi:predicted GNAT family acetyltransferase
VIPGYLTTLYEHLARHEIEAKEEGFMDVPEGEEARICSPERLERSLREPHWTRVWVVYRNGKVVAHATLYDLEQGDIVFGHIGIEGPYRGQGIARELQASRFAFLDKHGFTLTGAIYPGNTVSLEGCLANGFQVLPDRGDGKTWVCRLPGQPPPKEE